MEEFIEKKYCVDQASPAISCLYQDLQIKSAPEAVSQEQWVNGRDGLGQKVIKKRAGIDYFHVNQIALEHSSAGYFNFGSSDKSLWDDYRRN